MTGCPSERDSPNRRLFCFGLGYSALILAEMPQGQGWALAGTCRRREKRDELKRRGIAVHIFDRGQPLADFAAALAGSGHVLSSVPPDDDGDPVWDAHGADLAKLRGLSWLGYLSSSGVYGDHGGAWVDENTKPAPMSDRARRRAEAENHWLDLWRRHGVPVHVFRLAGIYGPGRSALEQVRDGSARRIDKPGQMFSRIHVEDIAQVLIASMARPNPGAIYNLADDRPAAPAEVIAYAAELLHLPPPPLIPFDAAELSPIARSFYAENKRVRNERMKRELGITLRYPSYREGLAALARSPASSK